jgi:hypothetical protein
VNGDAFANDSRIGLAPTKSPAAAWITLSDSGTINLAPTARGSSQRNDVYSRLLVGYRSHPSNGRRHNSRRAEDAS